MKLAGADALALNGYGDDGGGLNRCRTVRRRLHNRVAVARGFRRGGFRRTPRPHNRTDLVFGDFIHSAAVATPATKLLDHLNADRRGLTLRQILLDRSIDSQQITGIDTLSENELRLHVLTHEAKRGYIAANLIIRLAVQVAANLLLDPANAIRGLLSHWRARYGLAIHRLLSSAAA